MNADDSIHEYNMLRKQLLDLPAERNDVRMLIVEQRKQKQKLQAQIAAYKEQAEGVRVGVLMAAGGWASLGKNEGEREMKASELLGKSRAWLDLQGEIKDTEGRVADTDYRIAVHEAELANLEDQFSALKYLSRSFAGVMLFLGSAVEVPVPHTNGFSAENIGL